VKSIQHNILFSWMSSYLATDGDIITFFLTEKFSPANAWRPELLTATHLVTAPGPDPHAARALAAKARVGMGA
jgi:hypothetical protein